MNKKRIVIILMIIAIASKAVGFLREVTLSYFWGATNISDAYLISTTIPTTIFTFVGAGITTGFIPIYTEIKEKKGSILSNEFINKLFWSTQLICLLMIILGEVFCGQLVKIFASGFDQDTYNIALRFTRVSLFEIGFTTLMYILTAFLQSESSFIPAALASFPMNLMTITAIILSSGGNYYFLCIGCLAASFAQAFFLVPFAFRKGFKLVRVRGVFSDKSIKEMFLLALPTIIGTSVNDINVLVDRTLASKITVGGISSLNYAGKVNALLQGIIVLSIVSYVYPKFSHLAVQKKKDELKSVINEAVVTIAFLLLPATVFILFYCKEVITIIFGRGAFDEDAIIMTASVLFGYTIGMIANGLREVFSRVLFAFKDSKTPMFNGVLGMIANIILNLVLSKFLGIAGLALATSISSFFILILLIIAVIHKEHWKPDRAFVRSIIKISLLSLLLFVVIYLFRLFINFALPELNIYIALVIAFVVGAVFYISGAFILKIKEITGFISSIKNR